MALYSKFRKATACVLLDLRTRDEWIEMSDRTEGESESEPLIPRYAVSITAFVCAGALALMALLGPLGTVSIQYRTSQSGIWQTEGGDLVNLLLITPILLIASLSMFTVKDTPMFKPRSLRIYVGVMGVFLLMFAAMWISELLQVVSTGDTSSGSYGDAPTVFWVIRYFDLGVTIPLGFLALFLLLTKPERSYSMILLFFGFFITLGTAVNSLGWVMYITA